MNETILNIYLVIENGRVVSFKAKSYETEGDDGTKINYLKSLAKKDYDTAKIFSAPQNKLGNFMPYKKFAKLEEQGLQYRLFEEIFSEFKVPEKPLICVTPVVDGKILAE